MRSSLILLLLTSTCIANAQWTQTSGPGVGGINVVYQHDGIIEAGTDIEGVYQSSDGGTTWVASNTGIEKTSVRSLGSNTTYLFAGVDFDDRGHGGVYRRPIAGTTWTPVNTGISTQTVPAILVDGSTIYAGTYGLGVYKSTNNGDTWVLSNNGMGNENVGAIVKSGTVLFASGSNNLYRSTNNGMTWSFTNGGQYFPIFAMGASGTFIYAGGFQGLIRSTDSGNTWSTRIDIFIIGSGTHLSGFAVSGSTLYATTHTGPGAGVIKSTNNGLNWSTANTGIETVSLNTIINTGTSLVTGGSDKGVFVSTTNGTSWTQTNDGLPAGGSIRALFVEGTTLYAGTGGDGIHRSTNNGTTWENVSVDPGGLLKNSIVRSIASKDGILFAAGINEGVFKSTDNGNNWFLSSSGIPTALQILSLTESGTNVIAGTSEGIYYSTNLGTNWNVSNAPDGAVFDMAASAGFAYANITTGFTSSGLYRSSNGGVTWTAVLTSLTQTIVGLAAMDQYVYSGCFCPGGVRSTNFGTTWLGYEIFGVDGIYSLFPDGNIVYAGTGTSSDGIYQSTDFGNTFQSFNEGFEPQTAVEALAMANGYLFAGTNNRAVWRRAVGGVVSCDSIDTFQARCGSGGIVKTRILLMNSTGYEGEEVTFDIDGTEYSTTIISNGTHSKAQLQVNAGVGDHVVSLVNPAGCFDPISLDCTPVVSEAGEVWEWDEAENITENAEPLPSETNLLGNYPNPFNATTTIRYVLQSEGHVTLSIFTMLGQHVKTLVNEPQRAGEQAIVWDGKDAAGIPVTSGTYIYRLTADNFVKSGRMVMIR
jgi:hypothetical protein